MTSPANTRPLRRVAPTPHPDIAYRRHDRWVRVCTCGGQAAPRRAPPIGSLLAARNANSGHNDIVRAHVGGPGHGTPGGVDLGEFAGSSGHGLRGAAHPSVAPGAAWLTRGVGLPGRKAREAGLSLSAEAPHRGGHGIAQGGARRCAMGTARAVDRERPPDQRSTWNGPFQSATPRNVPRGTSELAGRARSGRWSGGGGTMAPRRRAPRSPGWASPPGRTRALRNPSTGHRPALGEGGSLTTRTPRSPRNGRAISAVTAGGPKARATTASAQPCQRSSQPSSPASPVTTVTRPVSPSRPTARRSQSVRASRRSTSRNSTPSSCTAIGSPGSPAPLPRSTTRPRSGTRARSTTPKPSAWWRCSPRSPGPSRCRVCASSRTASRGSEPFVSWRPTAGGPRSGGVPRPR